MHLSKKTYNYHMYQIATISLHSLTMRDKSLSLSHNSSPEAYEIQKVQLNYPSIGNSIHTRTEVIET